MENQIITDEHKELQARFEAQGYMIMYLMAKLGISEVSFDTDEFNAQIKKFYAPGGEIELEMDVDFEGHRMAAKLGGVEKVH